MRHKPLRTGLVQQGKPRTESVRAQCARCGDEIYQKHTRRHGVHWAHLEPSATRVLDLPIAVTTPAVVTAAPYPRPFIQALADFTDTVLAALVRLDLQTRPITAEQPDDVKPMYASWNAVRATRYDWLRSEVSHD